MCMIEDSDDDIFSSNSDHRGDTSSRRGDVGGDGGRSSVELRRAC